MRLISVLIFCLTFIHPMLSMGQEKKIEGWPVPDLKGLLCYSISMKMVDGVEKITERFYTPSGGNIARISGNGRIFAYAVDHDQDPPIDYIILDPDGSGQFTLRFGPDAGYLIPDWVSK